MVLRKIIKKPVPMIFFLAVICMALTSIAAAVEIPENPDYLILRRVNASDIMSVEDSFYFNHSDIYLDTETSKPWEKHNHSLEEGKRIDKKYLSQLVRILNYIDFMNLPDSFRNNRLRISGMHQLSFELTVFNKGRIIQKEVLCDTFDVKVSSQKEMFRLAFLNFFLNNLFTEQLFAGELKTKVNGFETVRKTNSLSGRNTLFEMKTEYPGEKRLEKISCFRIDDEIYCNLKIQGENVFNNKASIEKRDYVDTINPHYPEKNELEKVLDYNRFMDLPDYVSEKDGKLRFYKSSDMKKKKQKEIMKSEEKSVRTLTTIKFQGKFKGRMVRKEITVENFGDLFDKYSDNRLFRLQYIILYMNNMGVQAFRNGENI